MAVYTTIDDAGLFYNTVLYTGTGSSHAITGVGFQPDLVWIKNRDEVYEHSLYDSVRGVHERIESDTNDVESTDTNGLTAFGADGFTVGSTNAVNKSTNGLVAWNWKAGTTSVPSGGSITPTAVSLNATSGFSIIAYGGASATSTIAHGLGVTPKFIMVKCLSSAYNWQVGSTAMDSTWNYVIYLNKVNAQANDIIYGDTAPDATYFTLGNSSEGNTTGQTYVAYVFAPVQGYSKFGTYEGNGNADGPFVYTGFRPAFIVIKNSDGVETWNMWDSKRSTSGTNLTNMNLAPSSDAAQNTASAPGGQVLDILSNGFKIRGSTTETNQSTKTMVYWAFAEFPFVSSNSKAGTAR